jgi:O-antigen/teichoic acid export membrane protein
MWFVRQRQFQMVARSRITQSTAAAGVQVTSGALSTGPSGLLFGYAMNTGAACLILGYSLLQDKSNRSAIKATTWQSIKQAFKDYDRFPKYSTWEALSNTASIQLPIILIAAVAAPKEAGYLMMANYVMQAPTALIGAAVGQVYLSQAAEKHRQGKLSEFTNEVLRGLFRTGVAPLLAIGAIAPFTFGLIFGTGWDRAGILVAWMTPWFILQFLTAPISMSLHVTGNQRAAFFLQLFGLVLRLGMVWSASQLIVTKTSETFAISGLVFYAIYLCITITKIRQAESAS